MAGRYDDQGFMVPDEELLESLDKLLEHRSFLQMLDGLIALCAERLKRKDGCLDPEWLRPFVADLTHVSDRAKTLYLGKEGDGQRATIPADANQQT